MILNFFRCVTAEALRANIDWKLAFLKGVGQFGSKFHVEEDVLHQLFFMSGKLERSILSCGIRMRAKISLVRFIRVHSFDGQADARTDKI